jgi:hypothetical protein
MSGLIAVAEARRALYFGCRSGPGHYLQEGDRTIWNPPPELPWTLRNIDSGLLKNGKHQDVYDGKLFWTGGGDPFWLAFVWWDNSVDGRNGSNSGFYVLGFDHEQRAAALEYACAAYPQVTGRQRQPLVLQP